MRRGKVKGNPATLDVLVELNESIFSISHIRKLLEVVDHFIFWKDLLCEAAQDSSSVDETRALTGVLVEDVQEQ